MARTTSFSYKARNDKGQLVNGRIDADARLTVLDLLRSEGLTPVEITEASVLTEVRNPFRLPELNRTVSPKDLAVATRQLSTMVSSGLPLTKALSILASQTEKPRLARALVDVRVDVQSGMTLSMALERHQEIFPQIMTSLVRAGETGGFLDKALNSIADTFESEARLRASIRSSMTYPVAVLLMAVVGVIAMLIFIVPVFENMFKDLGGVLPWPTQVLVTLSPIAAWGSPILLVVGLAFFAWWGKNKNKPWIRKIIDPIKLKIPVFGPLFKKIAIARFTRNFSSMIGAGVPIMQALGVVASTAGNWQVEGSLARVQESVRLGTTVSQPMASEKMFPPMVTQMISVGEDAGSLEVMLGKIADFYDQEIHATTTQLTALIEPLMIAFIGIVIGGMIVTLYLPIFTIFNVIR
ncbi:type II secretion system F family protein [Rhodoluna limnophila]|uniref:type II secretion system F family protein n=1 Tax=Rhodoluna limnophila TaxID=232537 RepID=UPI0011064B05|nr:type II secretion system F family protein [Rhodoluna limnophila]